MLHERVIKLESKVDLLDYKINNLNKDMDKQFAQVDKQFEKMPDQIMNKMKVWLLSIFIPMALTLVISLFTLAISFYKLF